MIWAGLGGDGLSLLLATSAEMAQLWLGDLSQDHTACGKSAGAVGQGLGSSQCGPLSEAPRASSHQGTQVLRATFQETAGGSS